MHFFFLFACVEQTLKNDPYIFSISFNNHISSYPRFIFRLLSNGIGNRLHYQQGKPLGTHTSVPFFLFITKTQLCVPLKMIPFLSLHRAATTITPRYVRTLSPHVYAGHCQCVSITRVIGISEFPPHSHKKNKKKERGNRDSRSFLAI